MYTLTWLITFIVLLFIELITINLVTIWFVIGSLAAMGVSYFTDSFLLQLLVFVVVSTVSLIITRPLIKKFKTYTVEATNSDRVLGKIGEVTKKIEENKYGEVKVYGNTWTAYSDQPIDVGEKVRVLKIDGVKLIVEKEED